MVRLHVGSYRKAGGEGLYAVDAGPSGAVRREAYAGAADASWAVQSSRTLLTYAVEERAAGAIGIHRREGDRWLKVAQFDSGGAEPCYLALDSAERRLAVANYGSGSIALFELAEDGLPLGLPLVRTNIGAGHFKDRQDGPHAHCVVFAPDGGGLYHVDLGTDQIVVHPLRVDGAWDAPQVAYDAPPGSGPRHLLFHPSRPTAMLVSELASTLTVLDVGGERLQPRRQLSTLPDGFAGNSLGGHLAINAAGDRIYVSNRGHDSIAVFSLDQTGLCICLQHVDTGGASPRFFCLLEHERLLAVVHEESGDLVLLRLLPDGRLEHTGQRVDIPGAAFVHVALEERLPAPV